MAASILFLILLLLLLNCSCSYVLAIRTHAHMFTEEGILERGSDAGGNGIGVPLGAPMILNKGKKGGEKWNRKMRSLWVSVTGKKPEVVTSSPCKQDVGWPCREEVRELTAPAYMEEERLVPGGPDPLHHSFQPTSP